MILATGKLFLLSSNLSIYNLDVQCKKYTKTIFVNHILLLCSKYIFHNLLNKMNLR